MLINCHTELLPTRPAHKTSIQAATRISILGTGKPTGSSYAFLLRLTYEYNLYCTLFSAYGSGCQRSRPTGDTDTTIYDVPRERHEEPTILGEMKPMRLKLARTQHVDLLPRISRLIHYAALVVRVQVQWPHCRTACSGWTRLSGRVVGSCCRVVLSGRVVGS
jgi:hypothetical protein